MTTNFVQAVRNNGIGNPGDFSVTTAPFTGIVSGDTVVGYVNLASGIPFTILDSVGNFYDVSPGVDFDAYGVTLYRFSKIGIRGVPTTLTIRASADIGGANDILFLEYGGVVKINAQKSEFVNVTTSPVTSTLTSTEDNSTIVGICNTDASGGGAGSGYTQRFSFLGGDIAEDRLQASAGAIGVAFTQAGDGGQGAVILSWALSTGPKVWLYRA